MDAPDRLSGQIDDSVVHDRIELRYPVERLMSAEEGVAKPVGLLIEASGPHAPVNDPVVVGPHGPHVIAIRIEIRFRARVRPDAVMRPHVVPGESTDDGGGLVLRDGSHQQQVAWIRRNGGAWLFPTIEGERVKARVGHPEGAVQCLLDVRRLLARISGELVLVAAIRERGEGAMSGDGVALDLDQGY